MMRVEVHAESVVEGLYTWFVANRWFTLDSVDAADLGAEAAAQHALLMLCQREYAAYRSLPTGVRSLVVRFVVTFLAELIRGSFSTKVWKVSWMGDASPAPEALAWLVVEQELHRSTPPAPTRH